jgi:transcriptional regulator with XRE-family HTH domain
MTPIKQGKYEFKKESLIDVRKKMSLSQAKMAELLGMPANTLSRWEIGTTVPDAKNLAGFYSLAKEHGITPTFFGLRDSIVPFQYNSVIIWDFQTTGIQDYWVKQAHDSIMAEIGKRFTGIVPELKAFTHPSQRGAIDLLNNLEWTVFCGEDEIFGDIVHHVKSDCGQRPEGMVLILITQDNGFIELIEDQMEKDVRVFIMSPQPYNNKLIEKVGQANSISWFPIALEQPKRTLKNQNTGWSWGMR